MLPISLRCEGRRALVAGGGNVALRKAESLLAAGMTITVVAPRIDARLAALVQQSGGACFERAYETRDLKGALLAIAATNDPTVNATIVNDAKTARILVNDAIEPERGTFAMQAVVRVGDLTFGIDSGASSPAFSKRLARELGERFGPEYDAAARVVARMRTYLRTALDDRAVRAAAMRELSEFPIGELATMNAGQAEHEVEAIVERLRANDRHQSTGAVVCATRGSALAMTQTRTVAARLALHGLATTLLNVTTMGDRVQDKPIAAIGTNVWVKELEIALREHRADYAVHSCKDLPGELETDMQLAAISAREDARDVFCSEQYAAFDALPSGAIVGTSSLRRRAFLQALRPDLSYEELRGNVDTRLRKLRDGGYDAIVLAAAGLHRLGIRATHTVPFEIEDVVPAVGQGALAIETRTEDLTLARRLRDAVNDTESELCVSAERAALRTLRAGCNAPLGIHATLSDGTLRITSAYAQVEASILLREKIEARVDSIAEAEALGTLLAKRLAARMTTQARLVVLPRTQDRPSRIAANLRAQGIEVIELREGDLGPDRDADLLLIPSSGSVLAARSYLETLRDRESRPRVIAMGPQSGAAASEAGYTPDLISADASIDAFVVLVTEQLKAR
jgi:hydroxymethylbilane synthase